MNVTLNIEGTGRRYPRGRRFSEIAAEYQPQYADDIVLVRFRGEIRELHKGAFQDGDLDFITTADPDGRSAYRRSVTFLAEAAAAELFPDRKLRVQHSVGQGYYCEFRVDDTLLCTEEKTSRCGVAGASSSAASEAGASAGNGAGEGPDLEGGSSDPEAEVPRKTVAGQETAEAKNGGAIPCSRQELELLGACMRRMVSEDLPIRKENLEVRDAAALFRARGRFDLADLLQFRRSSRVNVYAIGDYMDYYYSYMLPSTGYLRYFDLVPYQNGFMLMFPDEDTHCTAEFHPTDKLFRIIDDSAAWGEQMGVRTVGDLNKVIAAGKITDLILVQESYMEQKIGEIAGEIAADRRRKIVLIAGPSSSGKTTFSHRLSIQLTAHGLRPHAISLDDFYYNREDTPVDENGEYDFECLEAVDVPLFNVCLQELLAGEAVVLPVFNFKTGQRECRLSPLTISDGDVLVIEGIHGLNEKLSVGIPRENKYKIYVSALTPLNIDYHNNLATTDARLLRRIVRDARTRNTSPRDTIARWDSVRRGEEKNIFPYQEEADIMFNSALIYEQAVLKCYAEPLLFSVESGCPEYARAQRLLKFLDWFLPVPAEKIALNSILREFIGGGIFPV